MAAHPGRGRRAPRRSAGPPPPDARVHRGRKWCPLRAGSPRPHAAGPPPECHRPDHRAAPLRHGRVVVRRTYRGAQPGAAPRGAALETPRVARETRTCGHSVDIPRSRPAHRWRRACGVSRRRVPASKQALQAFSFRVAACWAQRRPAPFSRAGFCAVECGHEDVSLAVAGRARVRPRQTPVGLGSDKRPARRLCPPKAE